MRGWFDKARHELEYPRDQNNAVHTSNILVSPLSTTLRASQVYGTRSYRLLSISPTESFYRRFPILSRPSLQSTHQHQKCLSRRDGKVNHPRNQTRHLQLRCSAESARLNLTTLLPKVTRQQSVDLRLNSKTMARVPQMVLQATSA